MKLTANFRVEVQNDGRCTSSPLYAFMKYVNAIDNARKIVLAYFYLYRRGILNTQRQLSLTFRNLASYIWDGRKITL